MKKSLLFTAALLLIPAAANAHTGFGGTSGLLHGFGHPFAGLDHLLAMIAVGLWAAQLGGRALWAVPATFAGTMAIGGALALFGVSLPFVEPGIAASVLILGLLIAFAVRLPLAASAAIVALFATFHGYAHGTEIPATASGIVYAFGFTLATVLLHGLGIGMGVLIQRATTAPLVRFAGAAMAVAGVAIFLR